jgi:hypothetical protein
LRPASTNFLTNENIQIPATNSAAHGAAIRQKSAPALPNTCQLNPTALSGVLLSNLGCGTPISGEIPHCRMTKVVAISFGPTHHGTALSIANNSCGNGSSVRRAMIIAPMLSFCWIVENYLQDWYALPHFWGVTYRHSTM